MPSCSIDDPRMLMAFNRSHGVGIPPPGVLARHTDPALETSTARQKSIVIAALLFNAVLCRLLTRTSGLPCPPHYAPSPVRY